ncbi:unnamed protein product, partial [Mesorhabditis spiculigera]
MSLLKVPEGRWSNVQLEGIDFQDENFASLVCFEEYLPEGFEPEPQPKKQKKKQKVVQPTASTEVTEEESKEESTSEEKQKNKKKKPKKKKRKLDGVEETEAPKSKQPKLKKPSSLEGTKMEAVDVAVEEALGEVPDPEVQDPETSVAAVNGWHEFYLPEEIVRSLADMGFETPTEIQRLVLPSAVRDRLDILGAAETGSGKTLAYAIPAICRLLEDGDVSDDEKVGPRVLILAPTRELVVQVRKQVDLLLKNTKFRAMSIVGGLAQQKQERLLRNKPDILVATPGRLWALIEESDASKFLADMSMMRALIIDETDRMVEKGHFEELEHILNHVRKSATEKLQTFVFSATLTYVHPAQKRADDSKSRDLTPVEKLKRLIEITGLRDQRKVIDITREFGTAEKLDLTVLYLLHRYRGRTLIFTNSIDASRRFYGILTKLNFTPAPMLLHARMQQRQRLKNLERFAENPHSVLLATDVAARGLDIKGIEHVIHYQVPKTAEIYIHRSGRTARASQTGLTVLLVDGQDAVFYRRICKNLNREKDLPLFPIDAPELFSALRPRVKLAAELDSILHRRKKIRSKENWFIKAAEEADLELDDLGSRESEANEIQIHELAREEKSKHSELRAALAQPLPSIERKSSLKSRYITPELSKIYEKQATTDALVTLQEEKTASGDQKKKKLMRKLLNTRDVTHVNRKNRKHK